MNKPEIVSEEAWVEARRALLEEEKAWTRQRDRLAEMRRALPWVKVDKPYVFEDANGPVTLGDLFDGRRQLMFQHFMFKPDWQEGCVGCSFQADQVDGPRQHFEHNDLSFVAVSRAPVAKLHAYRERMGWGFRWVSSANNDFNYDYHVSFSEDSLRRGATYNFETRTDLDTDELPGVSVFYKDDDGTIYHTYSSYGRGDETTLSVYGWLDMTPRGRNETDQGNLTDWVRRHDRYENDGRTTPATL